LHRWANEPAVRAASFQSAAIPWETHVRWLARRLRMPKTVRIYVVETPAHGPIGQVRFERTHSTRAVVSVAVSRQLRGQGVGPVLIRRGCVRAVKELRVRRVLAYIKANNSASIRAFERAGFQRLRRLQVAGVPSLLLVWKAGSR
jgi:RimJ/RimL family protein N-acetyltransferase